MPAAKIQTPVQRDVLELYRNGLKHPEAIATKLKLKPKDVQNIISASFRRPVEPLITPPVFYNKTVDQLAKLRKGDTAFSIVSEQVIEIIRELEDGEVILITQNNQDKYNLRMCDYAYQTD